MTEAFFQAISEIEALGFRVTEQPAPGSTPYIVLAGRSNPRWWLAPLANRSITTSSLALFQPTLTSAKLLKGASALACSLGLAPALFRKKLYVLGKPDFFADLFRQKDLHYAFFTGTDSPHRKIAVQVMDNNGRILGYAKATLNPSIKPLLQHEASTLHRLRELGLQSADIPSVLYMGEVSATTVLVTDTQKTPQTKTSLNLTQAHISFQNELAQKTAATSADNTLVDKLQARYERIARQLPDDWQGRIEKCLNHIARHGEKMGQPVLSHGDFTPWNTFFNNGKLYVFDWEYATQDYPAGYDLAHFLLSLPATRKRPAAESLNVALSRLIQNYNKQQARAILVTYLCGHALHYLDQAISANLAPPTWRDTSPYASWLDTYELMAP